MRITMRRQRAQQTHGRFRPADARAQVHQALREIAGAFFRPDPIGLRFDLRFCCR